MRELEIKSHVNEAFCSACTYWQETRNHENMVKNNICPKRDLGNCERGMESPVDFFVE